MARPSQYELDAWNEVQQAKARPMSRAVRSVSQKAGAGAARASERASEYLDEHPKARAAVSRGQDGVAKGIDVVRAGTSRVISELPTEFVDWTGAAAEAIQKTLGRAARAGLSSKRVVSLHQKRGHDVADLADLRRLDLQQIDAVGLRGAGIYYPVAAALSGAGAGLFISGGELVTAASAGAAAAPSGGVIVGAIAGDAAVVLGLASRAVGHIGLLYGYDPEKASEKLFVMSVVNAGTAASASAKTAAFSDISRLTQALVRGKSWEILDKSIVAKVSKQFATAFGFRITKQGLGKVVPAAGIVLGGAFNWTTLEGVFDAAETAYRRRFLLEKYPELGHDASTTVIPVGKSDLPEDADETISVLDDLAAAGGPKLS